MIALGFWIGRDTYMRSAWNVMDGFLVIVSWVDVIVSLTTDTQSSILGVLRVFRALRTHQPGDCPLKHFIERSTKHSFA